MSDSKMYQKIAIVSLLAAHVFVGAMQENNGGPLPLDGEGKTIVKSMGERLSERFNSINFSDWKPSQDTVVRTSCGLGALVTAAGAGYVGYKMGHNAAEVTITGAGLDGVDLVLPAGLSKATFLHTANKNRLKTGFYGFGLFGAFSGFTAAALRPGSIMGLLASIYKGASNLCPETKPEWVTPKNAGIVTAATATIGALGALAHYEYNNRGFIQGQAAGFGAGAAHYATAGLTGANKYKWWIGSGLVTAAGLTGAWYYGLGGKIAGLDYSGGWSSFLGYMPSMPSIGAQRYAAFVAAAGAGTYGYQQRNKAQEAVSGRNAFAQQQVADNVAVLQARHELQLRVNADRVRLAAVEEYQKQREQAQQTIADLRLQLQREQQAVGLRLDQTRGEVDQQIERGIQRGTAEKTARIVELEDLLRTANGNFRLAEARLEDATQQIGTLNARVVTPVTLKEQADGFNAQLQLVLAAIRSGRQAAQQQ